MRTAVPPRQYFRELRSRLTYLSLCTQCRPEGPTASVFAASALFSFFSDLADCFCFSDYLFQILVVHKHYMYVNFKKSRAV